MAEPFLGQISIFPYNFAPRNWSFCNGTLLSIAQNTALFSLLGTTYGGNGQTTFALPDCRSRVSLSQGSGPGLSPYVLGQMSGSESNTMSIAQMPGHNHTVSVKVNGSEGGTNSPSGGYPGKTDPGIYAATSDNSNMGAQPATGLTGGNQPTPVIQPYLGLNFCIALQGIFPSRN